MSVTSLRSSTREVEFGFDGAVFIACFYSWPSRRVLAALAAAQTEHRRDYLRGYSLSIIPNFTTSAEASTLLQTPNREELADLSISTGAQFEASTVANALVILPNGMLGVMIRTFMATMMFNPRMRTKVAVLPTIADAEAHFRAVVNGPPMPERLAEGVEAWLQGKRVTL
ncbi:MAG: hypothetical protein Q8Q09_26340 [Deltaproteobacteria bacterium]|nr:hypothetical protein [Deltaproteobacteria bacterium]